PSGLNSFTLTTTRNTFFSSVMPLLIPATILAIPIFDTTLVTITRKLRSQRATIGGTDHSSHRLVVLGLSPRKTVWVLYGLASLGSLVAMSMQRFPDQAMPLFGLFALVLLLSGVYLGHVK